MGKIRSAIHAWSKCGWGRWRRSGQRREVSEQVAKLQQEAEIVYGDGQLDVGADAEKGAFMAPTLFYCRDTSAARDDSFGRGIRTGLHCRSV